MREEMREREGTERDSNKIQTVTSEGQTEEEARR